MLQHDAHLPVERLTCHLACVVTVDQQLTLRGQVKPRDEVDDRTLAASRVADQRDQLAGLRNKVDVVQHRRIGVVPEREVAQFHTPLNRRQLHRIGRIDEIRLRVQHRKHTLRTRHRRQRRVVLPTDHVDRREKEV